jgi:hypothetical protein
VRGARPAAPAVPGAAHPLRARGDRPPHRRRPRPRAAARACRRCWTRTSRRSRRWSPSSR